MSTLADNISDFIHVHNNIIKSPKTITVFGDLMLDLYDQVHVNRLSPEFPIPVIEDSNSNCIIRPGGAGNVCEQLKHFKSDTYLFSFISNQALSYLHWNCKFTNTSHQCPCQVPLKRRYYDGDFPLCRMDNEMKNYGLREPEKERAKLLKKFIKFADKNKIDAIIISDYNKGVFNEEIAKQLIQECRNRQITTIVDPKKNPFQWQNCTIFKPNLVEAASSRME